MLYVDSSARWLSTPHTAAQEPERARVQAAGASVACLQGTWRVGTQGLQVTRRAASQCWT